MSQRYLATLRLTATKNVILMVLVGRYLIAVFAPKNAVAKAAIGRMMARVVPDDSNSFGRLPLMKM